LKKPKHVAKTMYYLLYTNVLLRMKKNTLCACKDCQTVKVAVPDLTTRFDHPYSAYSKSVKSNEILLDPQLMKWDIQFHVFHIPRM
jgi:hypothetical protein